MNRITYWFLKQDASSIFLLSFLGLPALLWIFSIHYQLRKKSNGGEKMPFFHLVLIAYPLIYIFPFIFIVMPMLMTGGLKEILPFHFAAMACSFMLLFLAARSYNNYSKTKKVKHYSFTEIFFMIWFYPIGIWSLQPILNEFMDE